MSPSDRDRPTWREFVSGTTILLPVEASSSAAYRSDGGPVFGRERELTKLEELIDGVSEHGAALLVRGEPGIGLSVA